MVYTLVVHMKAKSDPICIEKLKNKLIEASQVYSKDKETVSWLVMQSVFDKREFTIVLHPPLTWRLMFLAANEA